MSSGSSDFLRPVDLPPHAYIKSSEISPLPPQQPITWRRRIYRLAHLAISVVFPWIVRPLLTGLMFATGAATYRWIINFIFSTNYAKVCISDRLHRCDISLYLSRHHPYHFFPLFHSIYFISPTYFFFLCF